MSRARSYTDEELRAAVARSRSWRGVLRSLGMAATSSSAIRSVRRHAETLGLDAGHFTGQRRWTDDQLVAAVRDAGTWAEVVTALGLSDESSQVALRGHAARLGLETTHLSRVPDRGSTDAPGDLTPQLAHLRRAGSLLAAGWLALTGHDVSWPLEPCRYDLVVNLDGRLARVQVKTATVRAGTSWTVWLSTTSGGRNPYDPDEIDYFYVIDGDLSHYLIPMRTVAGLHAINLARCEHYRIDTARTPTP